MLLEAMMSFGSFHLSKLFSGHVGKDNVHDSVKQLKNQYFFKTLDQTYYVPPEYTIFLQKSITALSNTKISPSKIFKLKRRKNLTNASELTNVIQNLTTRRYASLLCCLYGAENCFLIP